MASWNTSVNIPPDYGVVKKSTPKFRPLKNISKTEIITNANDIKLKSL